MPHAFQILKATLEGTKMTVSKILLLTWILSSTIESIYTSTSEVPSVGPVREGCPRKEDIHPCECLEIPKGATEGAGMETVAFCKTIRNNQVLQNAMKGMQGHLIDFMVLDSCKLPPFPNGLFFNISIKWMEILNSTIQFKQNFFECANNCW